MRFLPFLLLGAAALAAAGCQDTSGLTDWDATPDTVTLFAANRSDLAGFPGAFDFINASPAVIEQPGETGNWDIVLLQQGTGFQLAPAGAILAANPRAGLAPISGETFQTLKEAPADTADFVQTAPVPAAAGAVFAVRTRFSSCSFTNGFRYAKLHVIGTDPANGTLTFEYVHNPFCDIRDLIPPDQQ